MFNIPIKQLDSEGKKNYSFAVNGDGHALGD